MHKVIYFGVMFIKIIVACLVVSNSVIIFSYSVCCTNCPSGKQPVVHMCSPTTQQGKTVYLDASELPDDDYIRTCSCTLSTNDSLNTITVQSSSSTEEFQFAVNGNEHSSWSSGVSFNYMNTGLTVSFRQLQDSLRVPTFCFEFHGVFRNQGSMRKFQITCHPPSKDEPRVTTTTTSRATTTRSTATKTTTATLTTTTTTKTTIELTTYTKQSSMKVMAATSSEQATLRNTTTPEADNTTTTPMCTTQMQVSAITGSTLSPKNTQENTLQEQVPGTSKQPSNESGINVLKETDAASNIGVIAGAAAGAVIAIVVVFIITVIVCKRRTGRNKKEHEETSDLNDKDPNYDMTINAGYVSVEACQKKNDVKHDSIGYALVNKPKPAHKPTQASSSTEYAEYNHLNGVFDKRTPAENVYNTAAGSVEDADMGDYIDITDVPHNRTRENVYNTATGLGSMGDVDTCDYNRLNEIQNRNVTENVYNVANAGGNTISVYNHVTDRT